MLVRKKKDQLNFLWLNFCYNLGTEILQNTTIGSIAVGILFFFFFFMVAVSTSLLYSKSCWLKTCYKY